MQTNTTYTQPLNIATLDSLEDSKLVCLDWKSLNCFNGRLLELHAEGKLGNDGFAKLPRKPILCIDQIDLLNEERIEASFTFPSNQSDWPFDIDESLEMLFQDQLDQLVGFWAARKLDGVGRALSSGACILHQTLDFQPSKVVRFVLEKRKWMENRSNGGGTAVFNAQILDAQDELLLETKNVIVGILHPDDIRTLREKFGGSQGVNQGGSNDRLSNLQIPIYGTDCGSQKTERDYVFDREATMTVNPDLWPLRYHFLGDPVLPGNFGTHGMIALLKAAARDNFGLMNPVFKSMSKKSFSGMIFEDQKQVRFRLSGIYQNELGDVVAEEARLYLEDIHGCKYIDTPIYTFKNLSVTEDR